MGKMRGKFLSEVWESYPSMPLNSIAVGRILAFDEKKLKLDNGQMFDISTADLVGPCRPISQIENFHALQVLCIGDLISIQAPRPNESGDSIILLAPNLSEQRQEEEKYPEGILRLRKFSEFKQKIQDFFRNHGFWQATTPNLVPCPGTEPYLDVFETEFRFGKNFKTLFLPTSPEIQLKKLISMGSGPVFEIKNVFRNGENSPHHEPEFSMLEWYRPYANHLAIAEDLKNLICHLSPEKTIEFETYSVQELFEKVLQFNLRPDTDKSELAALARSKNLILRDSDSIDDIFNLIFIEMIEPALSTENPVFVHSYPEYLAAYSRINSSGWADRFELYWRGLEIANAFHELNDPKAQMARMKADMEKRSQIGKKVFPIDEKFIQLLKFGMPPTGGIAVGVDRLFMACNKLADISELYPFSVKNHEEKEIE